ncbi:hypothetical protein OE88DRAFT_1718706 [Heliocybe sulcata]|uniref:Transcription factor IIIC putative zinc-finger domain-containing protein n=1 Tax=Heliocybe sulcata TaxID=5364 RepID=A0A5C3N7L3_9AGAM|nr:hypothetical protein OE88DRAFT_1718706 [Heliocybe sulcata]
MSDTELKTYASLVVPTSTTHPSADCLQWSADGQALLTTKSALYILTPDAGINFDSSSVIRPIPGKGNKDGDTKSLAWFRTMIEFGKAIVYQWPLDHPDWAAASLGSFDPVLRAVTSSPINVDGAGCIVAVLNSNLELTLWGTAKNHLRGEWKKMYDITALLRGIPCSETKVLERTLRAQILCISWSAQVPFDIAPSPNVDASLLATGSRGGSISFFQWRYKMNDDDIPGPTAVHVHAVTVADQWVTHLAWSPWLPGRGPRQSEAYLACAVSDGSVAVLKVSARLSPAPSETQFGTEYTVQRDFEVGEIPAFKADRRIASGLRWVETPGRNLVLVCTKPGLVDVTPWPIPSNLPWSGPRRMILQRQQVSADSSPLYPVSGLTYVEDQDVLILSLFDGSFHTIHSLTSQPTLAPSADGGALSAEYLSSRARRVFSAAESGTVTKADVGRISGMMSYDGSSTLAWIHEKSNPSDFSYKPDARQNSMLIVTQMWKDPRAGEYELALPIFADALECARTVWARAPLHFLRPVFLWLGEDGAAMKGAERLLKVLQSVSIDESASIHLPLFRGSCTTQVKREFRNSIDTHLYGWDSFLRLRLRFAVADHCWELTKGDPHIQNMYGESAHGLLNLIFQRVQRVLIRHLKAVTTILTADDIPFVMRVVLQATLPGSPAELSIEAQELASQMNKVDADNPHLGHSEEVCPACQTVIPLQDLTSATCGNGHVWRRCSITTFILSTPKVRTCVGCSRKALLPTSEDPERDRNCLPAGAQGWAVAELLRAVQRCLFCGNSFVSIV